MLVRLNPRPHYLSKLAGLVHCRQRSSSLINHFINHRTHKTENLQHACTQEKRAKSSTKQHKTQHHHGPTNHIVNSHLLLYHCIRAELKNILYKKRLYSRVTQQLLNKIEYNPTYGILEHMIETHIYKQ